MSTDVMEKDLEYWRDRALRAEQREGELVAHVERLREALQDLDSCMEGVIEGDYTPDSFTRQPAQIALSEMPTQSLREVRAEAGREGVKAGISIAESCKWDGTDPAQVMGEEAERYAQQIRQGKQ